MGRCGSCRNTLVALVASIVLAMGLAPAQALAAGGDIVLTADVAPENPYWADALTVPADVTATLDLNGHTVDRGYREQGFDGSVIIISGELTLTDSDPAMKGAITGGFPDQYGGGVQIQGGTFNMQGGSISGNSVGVTGFFGVDGLGGGVYVQSGTFNMSGGTISGNKALGSSMGNPLGRGGGVYITGGTFNFIGGTISGNDAGIIGGGVYLASTYSGHDGIMNVSGSATVTDNTVGSKAGNVYLEEGGVLNAAGTLTGAIGVTMQTPGAFTSGLPGKGTKANFKSDDAGLGVLLTDAGEAQLGFEEYPLWVGGVQVTSANAEAIQGEGITGTVRFDPDSSTLTLSNVTITGTYDLPRPNAGSTANIYTTLGSLAVALEGSNSLSGGTEGIYSKSSITVTGANLIITDCINGIWASTGDIRIYDSDLTASVSNKGFNSGGSFSIKNSVVIASGGSNGIKAMGSITIEDSTVEAAGDIAIDTSRTKQSEITITDADIIEPAGGYILANGYIANSDDSAANYVLIGTPCTVTYKVANGTWSDGTDANKTETVAKGLKPAKIPTGMLAAKGFTGGAWDTDPAAAVITGAAIFTYSFEPLPSYTVTVVGGTADKVTARAGETVTITAADPEAGYAFAQWAQVDGANFDNASAAKTTFVMPAKDVTVTADFREILTPAISDKTYTGQAIEPTFGPSDVKLDGVDGQFVQGADYDLSYGENVDVGEGTVTLTMKAPRTGSKTLTFAITPRPLTITVDGASKTEGEVDPAFTGTVSGLIADGDLGKVKFVRTGGDEAPGTYAGVITVTYDANGNYDVTVVPGDFTIKKKPDAPGSAVAPALLVSKKQTKGSITLSWTKVKGAKGYTVYGNICGKGNKYVKLATVGASKKSYTVKAVVGAKGGKAKLRKGTMYKFRIVADMGAASPKASWTAHVATAGRKDVSNHTDVAVGKNVISKAKKMKVGTTLKLKAKAVKKKGTKVRVHVGLRYASSNAKVAAVDRSGKVKARGTGTCYVYAFAQNGVCRKVEVTVR